MVIGLTEARESLFKDTFNKFKHRENSVSVLKSDSLLNLGIEYILNLEKYQDNYITTEIKQILGMPVLIATDKEGRSWMRLLVVRYNGEFVYGIYKKDVMPIPLETYITEIFNCGTSKNCIYGTIMLEFTTYNYRGNVYDRILTPYGYMYLKYEPIFIDSSK